MLEFALGLVGCGPVGRKADVITGRVVVDDSGGRVPVPFARVELSARGPASQPPSDVWTGDGELPKGVAITNEEGAFSVWALSRRDGAEVRLLRGWAYEIRVFHPRLLEHRRPLDYQSGAAHVEIVVVSRDEELPEFELIVDEDAIKGAVGGPLEVEIDRRARGETPDR